MNRAKGELTNSLIYIYMSKKRILLLACFISIILFSCTPEIAGSGSIITQTYTPFSNFTKVSVDADIDVTVTYGLQKSVKVTGYSNLMDHFKISASGGVLRIGMKTEYTYTNMNLTAIVVMPSITQLTVTNAGNISIDTFPTTPNLTLVAEGSGNISALTALRIGSLTTNISSTGSIDISGTVNDENVEISGSGNFNAYSLRSSNCTVNSMSSGNSYVNARVLLTALISGSGNVYYKTYPDTTSTITGTGTLIDAN